MSMIFTTGFILTSLDDPVIIRVELIVGELSAEQKRKFSNNIAFWNTNTKTLVADPPLESLDDENIEEVIRVAFNGSDDIVDDDITGETFFCSISGQDNASS
ncbi:hypothetical protein ACEN9X_19360 [Mucilaginibacter sp. Mucisp86]|uniref:hypothetical protein n=1 Tax=Mucilaginibacter sp. Mucisp86 TaxID=3243060 RepID=UPI0039B366EA